MINSNIWNNSVIDFTDLDGDGDIDCFICDANGNLFFYRNDFGVLPVELNSFSASLIAGRVKLIWSTETEVNNYGFEILRLVKNDNWTKIGFVLGSGNSNSPKSYYFTDDDVEYGKYSYRLKQIDNDGQFELSKIIEIDLGSPKAFNLYQNYPNPFNPLTEIIFEIPIECLTKIIIINVIGESEIIFNKLIAPGKHRVIFNGSNHSSGVYFYQIVAQGFISTKKMILKK